MLWKADAALLVLGHLFEIWSLSCPEALDCELMQLILCFGTTLARSTASQPWINHWTEVGQLGKYILVSSTTLKRVTEGIIKCWYHLSRWNQWAILSHSYEVCPLEWHVSETIIPTACGKIIFFLLTILNFSERLLIWDFLLFGTGKYSLCWNILNLLVAFLPNTGN